MIGLNVNLFIVGLLDIVDVEVNFWGNIVMVIVFEN